MSWGRPRIPNLTDGPHSVLITVTSATDASNKVYIDWIGGSMDSIQSTGPALYLGNTLRMNAAGYVSGARINGSDAAVVAYNEINQRVADFLAEDNLNVTYVDADVYYNLSTDVASDHIHPNDAGHQHIADAFLDAMNAHLVDLRQTGQTSSYGTGDDGAQRRGAEWPSPGTSDNGDGTVTDNLTGLMWTKDGNLPGGVMTWQQALNYVASMNSGAGTYGYTDWRLPTVNELQSLINAQQSDTAAWLNAGGGFGNPFVNIQTSSYWSSTTYAGDTTTAWVVYLGAGSVYASFKSDAVYVWPVRAGQASAADPSFPSNIWKTGQTTSYDANIPSRDDGALQSGVTWPSPRFTDNGDGTVADNLTGLVWLKNANCFRQPHAAALSSANSLASGQCGLTDGSSAGDWRLPNREELQSLIDFSQYAPSLSAGYPFTNVQQDSYSSSTTYAGNTTGAYIVSMLNGYITIGSKADSYYVWPVRAGGLFGNPSISVSPNTMNFGNINPGGSSSLQSFIITNAGTNNLYMGTITLAGLNPDEFNIAAGSDSCSNSTIAPSGTCGIDVIFSPTSGGPKSASLSIPSNAPLSPYTVSLTGTGTQYTVTVTGIPGTSAGHIAGGNGIDCGVAAGGATSGTCVEVHDMGSSLVLTASPAGDTSVIWTGCSSGIGNTCNLTLTADTAVTVLFHPNTLTITTTSEANGTISCPESVPYGETLHCDITPSSGYYLKTLTDNSLDKTASVYNGTYTVSDMTTDHIINVNFQSFPINAHLVDLRQTGQTSSYGTGDDGAQRRGAEWPSPGTSDNGDGTVTDNLTGLMWTKDGNLPGGVMTWQQALNYVASMNSGAGTYGYTDWRLPTVNELQSLINAQQSDTAAWLNAGGGFGNPFVNIQTSSYWSSTTYAGDTTTAWVVYLGAGSVYASFKSDAVYVWPVRAGQASAADPSFPSNIWKTGQTTSYDANIPSRDDGALQSGVTWPSPRFTDNGDGTVADNLTGLVWLKNANCFRQSHAAALSSANSLASGQCGLTDGSSAGDWRLPNREELQSLIDFSQYAPSLSAGYPFTNVQQDSYSSSTTYVGNTTGAYIVSMLNGYITIGSKADSYYVWPVRAGGLFGNPSISVSPNTMNFGNINPGGSSSLQSFIITNAGTNNLYMGTITLAGLNPDEFNIAAGSDSCSNSTIAPSGTCGIDVIFSPTSGGPKSASLSIPSNAPLSPYTVSLTGTGTQYTVTVTGIPGTSAGHIAGGNGIDCGVAAGGATSGTCVEVHDMGSSLVLTASPAGDTSVIWTGCSSGIGNTCSVTLVADTAVTVLFHPNTLTITTTSEANGTISCPESVPYGETLHCDITPSSGYYLKTLTDNSLDKTASVYNGTYTVSDMTTDHTINVSFQSFPLKRLSGVVSHFYLTLQAAYDAAVDGDVIQIQAEDFNENLIISHSVSVIFKGGYDSDFTSSVFVYNRQWRYRSQRRDTYSGKY